MAPRWLRLAWTTPRQRPRRDVAGALAVFSFALAGCGTDAAGVDACRQIEEARCQQAPACGVALEPPHRTSGSDVSECIRFYDDACLHGLASGNDPGPMAVSMCLAAIRGASATNGDCAVIVTPASVDACAWLVPNVPAGDASTSGPDAGHTDGGAPE